MSKKLLRYFYFSLLFLFVACAPKPKLAPPPLYEERELSLEEVIAKVSDDIEVLKTIADIDIEKNNEPYSSVSASVLIKGPDWVHMRIYQLGILVRDFVIKDDTLYVLSGKNDANLKRLGKELYNAVFWWQGYSSGNISREGDLYIIKAEDREIHLDKTTLLPLKQEITALDKMITIVYDKPFNNEGFWYPGLLKIYSGNFVFTVKIKKLLKNPALGEADFQIPAES